MEVDIKQLVTLIDQERIPVIDALIHRPVIGEGSTDFRYQAGYAAGLQFVAELIQNITKGDA